MFWLLPILNSFVKQYLTVAVRTKITSNIEKYTHPTVKKIIIMWIYGCIKEVLKLEILSVRPFQMFSLRYQNINLLLWIYLHSYRYLARLTWISLFYFCFVGSFIWHLFLFLYSFITRLILTQYSGNNSDFYNILSNYTLKLFSCVH